METILFFIDSVIFNSLGLLFVALGILVSLRFTGYPDLTVDGSFTFGAALYALSIAHHVPVLAALLIAGAGGAVGGLATGILNQYFKMGQIISSITVMIFLILLIPYFSGNATVGLLNAENIWSDVAMLNRTLTDTVLPDVSFSLHGFFSIPILILFIIVAVTVYHVFLTRLGTALRYVGSATDPNLIGAHKQSLLILLGLMIGNTLVALGGAIEAERNGGFSQNMGTGMILIGIATMVLGESVWKAFKKRNNLYLHQQIAAVVTGVLIYTMLVQTILAFSISFVDIRLMTTGLILVLLAYVSRLQSNVRELF